MRLTMNEQARGTYTVKELADRAGVTPRTVYYYVGEGLLPPPEGGGPASTYTDDHLLRLQVIRRLKDEYLPLAEIRRRLADLTTDDLRALVDAPPAAAPPDSARAYLTRLLGSSRPAGSQVSSSPSRPRSPGRSRPAAGQRLGQAARFAEGAPLAREAGPDWADAPLVDAAPAEQWRRVRITPDVELHVRADAASTVRRRLDRMVAALRRILES